ncbi:membrane-associated guanylate kinase, WW and PDZ domain-containing protein 2-like [Octopus sinensis]|uniref:Membrane-associated guanylate kinase, WW and PDZ domain-containing protein 2-like n=1 Tax=Octopus sinensis TaxID=2607531 RepID=A0A6P7TS24_9MOLL|nr:membrane-associated guanylate kinase, WW and PDZ domain-containing protein 2-like [Octopus sinensis]
MISTLKSVNIEIDVNQPDKRLGFFIQTQQEDNSHNVMNIISDGAAERAGLRVGDRIVMVNGEDAINLSHAKLIKKIKKSKLTVSLQVNRDESLRTPLISTPQSPEVEEPNVQSEQEIEEPIPNEPVQEQVQNEPQEEPIQQEIQNETQNEIIQEEIQNTLPENTVPEQPLQDEDTIQVPEQAVSPSYTVRECTIRMNGSETYGFSITYSQNSPRHVISTVIEDSPAYNARVRNEDIVIEVNRSNVQDETHEQVVARVRNGPSEITLLLVDPVSWSYYTDNGIEISNQMPSIEYFTNIVEGLLIYGLLKMWNILEYAD